VRINLWQIMPRSPTITCLETKLYAGARYRYSSYEGFVAKS
jgi:hypothetical protein